MKAQLSWNFYLRIPESGGELRIWDRFWEEEDDEKEEVEDEEEEVEEVEEEEEE